MSEVGGMWFAVRTAERLGADREGVRTLCTGGQSCSTSLSEMCGTLCFASGRWVVLSAFFFFKQKTAYEISACLVGYDVAAFCMSQLDEKRRLLYWKFCRTIRAKHDLTRVC